MLRLAAIGLGGLAYVELDVLEELGGVEFVAGADVAAEGRELFEAEFGGEAYEDYESMLAAHGDDLDAALVTTPHALHFEHAMACLQRDLDVYVEKPMTTDLDDAVELVETARERDRVLQVGYQRHFHPGFLELRRLVEEGRVGTLHAVNCYLAQDWIDPHRDTWRTNPALSGGGQLYDSGSHLIDVLLWVTGTEPGTVVAQVDYDRPGIDVNSALAVTLDGERPVTTSVCVSGDGVDLEHTEGYHFWGTEGRVTFVDGRLTVADKRRLTYAATVEEGTDFRTLTREKLGNFLESVRGDAAPAVPGTFSVWVTALTEAAYLADETGEAVDVQAVVEEARARRG